MEICTTFHPYERRIPPAQAPLVYRWLRLRDHEPAEPLYIGYIKSGYPIYVKSRCDFHRDYKEVFRNFKIGLEINTFLTNRDAEVFLRDQLDMYDLRTLTTTPMGAVVSKEIIGIRKALRIVSNHELDKKRTIAYGNYVASNLLNNPERLVDYTDTQKGKYHDHMNNPISNPLGVRVATPETYQYQSKFNRWFDITQVLSLGGMNMYQRRRVQRNLHELDDKLQRQLATTGHFVIADDDILHIEAERHGIFLVRGDTRYIYVGRTADGVRGVTRAPRIQFIKHNKDLDPRLIQEKPLAVKFLQLSPPVQDEQTGDIHDDCKLVWYTMVRALKPLLSSSAFNGHQMSHHSPELVESCWQRLLATGWKP